MQEKVKPVFIVATANDVSQLPPEMLRKGRFDELFFVDLPDEREREAIWKLVLERRNRKPINFDLQLLARSSEGLTGAEIEAVFLEAMFAAFERGDEPTEMDVAASMNSFVPLSKLMVEQIEALKKWSSGRARPSTSTPQLQSESSGSWGCEVGEGVGSRPLLFLTIGDSQEVRSNGLRGESDQIPSSVSATLPPLPLPRRTLPPETSSAFTVS
jgi:hypothetical protein